MIFRCAFNEAHLHEQIAVSNESEVLQKAYALFEGGNNSRAHHVIRQLVKGKHSLALVLSSMFSRAGETEKQFCFRHLAHLEAAALEKNPLALYSLGVYRDRGELLEEDKAKAFEYFRSAAELGMPQAMHIYGIMLYYGTGGANKDSTRGLSFVHLAAANGVDEATEFLRYIAQ